MKIHAFKCQRNGEIFYLFIWINQFGVKFHSRHVIDYHEAKQAFIEATDKTILNVPPGCLVNLPSLNEYILNSVEEFIL